MKRIYKTFWGQYIDLSKITSISPAKLMKPKNRNSQHKKVGFKIFFEMTDNPVVYRRSLSYQNEPKEFNCENYKNEEASYKWCGSLCYYHQKPKKNENGQYVAVVNLQKQIDSLIQDWREYINNPE